MGREDAALKVFRNGYNCAQAVLSAFTDRTGISEAESKAIAAGFGAGVGRLQTLCGAVSGGIMAIGAFTHDESNVAGSKALAYERVRAFIAEFERENGSTDCLRLLGANLQDPEMNAYANEKRLFDRKCERFVADACGILERMIEKGA